MSGFPPPSGVVLENPPCPTTKIPDINGMITSFKDLAYKKTLYALNGLEAEAEAVLTAFDEVFGGLWPLSANDPLFPTIDSFEIKVEQKLKSVMNEMQLFFIIKIGEILNTFIPFDVLEINLPPPLEEFTVGDLFDETARGEMKAELKDKLQLGFDLPAPFDKSFKPPFGPTVLEFKVIEWFQNIMTNTVNTLMQPLFDAFDALIGEFQEIWDGLGLPEIPTLEDVWTDIKDTIDGIFTSLGDDIDAIIDAIGEIEIPILEIKVKDLDTAGGRIKGVLMKTTDLARRMGVAFMGAIFAPFIKLLEWIEDVAEFFSDIGLVWPIPLDPDTGQLTFCGFCQFVLPGFPPDITSL